MHDSYGDGWNGGTWSGFGQEYTIEAVLGGTSDLFASAAFPIGNCCGASCTTCTLPDLFEL